MGRAIPIALQDHLDSGQTTTCYLILITPVQPNVPAYGVTTLNRPVVYDDGNGEVTYSAAIGVDTTAFQGNANLTVDNAEGTSLMPEFDVPISEEDIRAGLYDFARYAVYLVNYADLSMGHITLRSGTIGQVTIDVDGLSFVNEFRGLSAELKQSVCEKDSLSCRAIFGSQPMGSSIPGPIQRFPCGFDATSLLKSATVVSVGIENTLTFDITPDTDMGQDSLNPGIVVWSTGMNAGRTYEIDTNTAGGEITLAHETAFPIQIGDQLEYREDCSKLARDDEKGCRHWFGPDWVLHFRGEPDIPIGDAGAMETPGASSSPGNGGSTYQPISEE